MRDRPSRRFQFASVVLAALALAACSKEDAAPAPAATPAATAAKPAAATTAAATPAATPASSQGVFSREELDQMFAPIALYPDKLIAQVLMAATYPGNVADAAAWSKAHPEAKGDPAVALVADQPWDPSVQALVAFPQVLATLGQDPGWVQRMGDAFLAQPEAVMDSVQRLRRQAQQAGNLASNEYQKVSVEEPPPEVIAAAQAVPQDVSTGYAPPPPAPVIVIESAQPDTVYVPSYDPTTVYGTWAYPAYPPTYYPPPAAYYPLGGAMMRGIAWGTGLAIADSLWGDSDWWGGDVDINVNSYNNLNVNRQLNAGDNTWRHDPARRDGVPYRDQANRERYGRQLEGASDRAQFRGDDANRARQREQARASMERRGVDTPARSNLEAQARARDVARSPEGRAALEGRDPRAGGDRAAAADRARAQAAAGGGRDAAAARSQGQARQSQQRARQSQGNAQARNAARQQYQGQGRGRDNAFQGASQPRAAQSHAQRGRSSYASAQRPQSSRGGGQQVHRQAQAPRQHQASRGGGRPSSGGSRPASGGGRRR